MSHDELTTQEQDQADEALIQKALANDPDALDALEFNRELEPGEKADDAIDYEDISDDDLAEDEDEGQEQTDTTNAQQGEQVPFEHDAPGDFSADLDDLFGEGPPTSPAAEVNNTSQDISFDFDDNLFGDSSVPFDNSSAQPADQAITTRPVESSHAQVGETLAVEDGSDAFLRQKQLFDDAKKKVDRVNGTQADQTLPAPPGNIEQLLERSWPKFERNTVPYWVDLFPQKRRKYAGKSLLKTPKPVNPTKISLEIAQDQEKHFRFSTVPNRRIDESSDQLGYIAIRDLESSEKSTDDEMDIESDYENEPIGGITWQDFQVVCEDWDIESIPQSPSPMLEPQVYEDPDDIFGDLDVDAGRPSPKRRKTEVNILDTPRFVFSSMQDPARTTAKIARTVTLDLNDSNLLLDENRISLERAKRQASSLGFARDGIIVPSKDLYKRYNISNDESYDLLKENHQSRVRSTLSALALNHSMPALRLQWPYYKTKLPKQEARSFHRPQAHFKKGEPITFQIPSFLKRKHTKNKDATAIYNKTKDLSLGDNSHVLLLEYSEEHPMMLSNFGMCSRILNYYRKRNAEDTERPKCEVGEPRVLLLQDKSPLTIFGHIAAGETTPTLHNGLFQAPLFQQEAKSTDFLLVRNTTGTNGPKWFMRNIEHIRTVGQQLPSVDVPPPGGRKVTTAAKSRLKMISYRIIRRRNPHRISVADVTQHIADSTDMQNRQKLKDFMVFSKEYKEWEMRPGDPIPEEENVRTLVSPDDVCLLESTQVGQQHLEDSGFDATVTINEDGDDAKEGQSIEQQLAPWVTSKNFLNAAAGKAMLQLHGEGDPSGRGEAFSFLKTSMKGGFKAVGESVEDKIDAKKLKEMGGHSYNVAKQQKAYEEAIERIWEAQKQSLSSTIEHSDSEGDADEMNDPYEPNLPGMTPRSELPTPSIIRRRDDETMSSFSKFSTDSQAGRVLRITRVVESRRGGTEEVVELVTNARVIRQYLRRQKLLEAETIDLSQIKAGDSVSTAQQNLLKKELARLERNKERRLAREKSKHGSGVAGSPGSPSSPGPNATAKGAGGTQRKCANCGQVGHIKTNKKLCPLLNGTMRPEEGFGEPQMSAPQL